MRALFALSAVLLAAPAAHAWQVACDRTEVWEGEMVDSHPPSSRARLELCFRGESVGGQFRFDSAEAGWDRRSISGERDADGTLRIVDGAMIESHPKNGWRLCKADGFDLYLDEQGHLVGNWESTDCNDRGTLDLLLVSPSATSTPPPPMPAPAPNYPMIPISLLALCSALLLARRLRARAVLVPPLS